MTKVISDIKKFKIQRTSNLFRDKSVGLVPTMGALHEGHLALINKSLIENDITVVSIFVNQTQFNNKEDFKKYPNTFKEDLHKLKKLKVDFIFYPTYEEMYPDNYNYKVIENNFSKILCGKYRPGHFDGVLTVVLKLLNIVKARKAYFGEKDYQQLKLIEGMTKAFFIDTEIIPVPTVRSAEGLALSSRNLRLSEKNKIKAVEFPRILSSGFPIKKIKLLLKQKGFIVEYVEQIDNRLFAAVYLGKVRLIDNVKV
jgi:pantoate--beta-alanine ligase